ncbi:MAG TPA: FAD-dependent oxidoreductase [Candidatus Cryosericum sp.]|nr:FAD-dependent oxidoreductase [Candidatus Cryosericum sp.]
MRVVIVGGNAGGATAATRLRRLRPDAEIVLVERGAYVSYANCGLLYYLEGVMKERSALFVETADSLRSKHGIDVRIYTEAVSIDPATHTVRLRDLTTQQTSVEHYDKLLLAMGAEPVFPHIPGIDSAGVVPLWSVPHMDAIADMIAHGARSAVILGGGYVGCAASEALHERGLEVTLLEVGEQVLSFLDPDVALYAQQELEAHGIAVRTDARATQVVRDGRQLATVLEDGQHLASDLVVVCTGVRPASRIARDAGLAVGRTGGIVVSPSLRTSDPDIYAVGDVIEVQHAVTGEPVVLPLAGPAHKQARIAATNIANRGQGWTEQYPGTLGSTILKLYDLTCGATGANSKQLERRSIPFKSVLIHPLNHAEYYPGATPVHLKLLYGLDGKVLGAQAVGHDGVDKRIDVLATAISFGARVEDLDRLQLAYSPPFSSARDPVNIAGSVADIHNP